MLQFVLYRYFNHCFGYSSGEFSYSSLKMVSLLVSICSTLRYGLDLIQIGLSLVSVTDHRLQDNTILSRIHEFWVLGLLFVNLRSVTLLLTNLISFPVCVFSISNWKWRLSLWDWRLRYYTFGVLEYVYILHICATNAFCADFNYWFRGNLLKDQKG